MKLFQLMFLHGFLKIQLINQEQEKSFNQLFDQYKDLFFFKKKQLPPTNDMH